MIALIGFLVKEGSANINGTFVYWSYKTNSLSIKHDFLWLLFSFESLSVNYKVHFNKLSKTIAYYRYRHIDKITVIVIVFRCNKNNLAADFEPVEERFEINETEWGRVESVCGRNRLLAKYHV